MALKMKLKIGKKYTIRIGNFWDKPFWGYQTRWKDEEGEFARACEAVFEETYFYFKFIAFGKMERIKTENN